MSAKRTRINEQIQVETLRLIDKDGQQVGVVSLAEALANAEQVSLDLVEISPQAEPPVCRIMDYGKYLFEQNKRKVVQKKKQHTMQVKEVKFRPTTEIADYRVKLRKIVGFLEHGDKVKMSVRFRGREMQHRELGLDLLHRIQKELENIANVEQEAKLEGRQMLMVMVPIAKVT